MKKLDYNEDDIKTVENLTGLSKAKAEKYILEIYKDCEDEEMDIFDILDIIESETKVKKNNIKNVVVTTSNNSHKERKPRERKVDSEKANILSWLENGLWQSQKIECTRENEVKLHFVYNGSEYTVNLVKHRPKK